MDNRTIAPDQLSSSITELTEEFIEEIEQEVLQAIVEVSNSIKNDISAQSPKETGGYAKGWSVKVDGSNGKVGAIIYNASKPGLAHLLEKGHLMRGGGRSPAYPHIAPAADKGFAELQRRLRG